MKKVIILYCLIILGFALTGCTSGSDLDQVGHEEITNMSQLPFDLTKLDSESKSIRINSMFLSTTVEPYIYEFDISKHAGDIFKYIIRL